MLKIILIAATAIFLILGLFFWFKSPPNSHPNPITETIGKVLGFDKGTTKDNTPDLLDQTKDSIAKNTQKTIDTAKSAVYDDAKTTLDIVFDKHDDKDKTIDVTVLGVTNTNNIDPSYTIDLSKDANLNLSLSTNKQYYLKFQNIPENYCIYIDNNKYPLSDGTISIKFASTGSYPIKANSCNLNDKNIGTLTVQ